MLDYARAGVAVVVTAIDRLGRSVAEVTRTIADLEERRILLRALRPKGVPLLTMWRSAPRSERGADPHEGCLEVASR
jgi:DNA invertase Pin-like site-specific DNA recombinase